MEVNTRPKRKKNRLAMYRYSQAGYYFVTICVKNKICSFGKIDDNVAVLSDKGLIAQQCWREIPDHFQRAVIDDFVIMPNHLHGIIVIKNNQAGNNHGCERNNHNYARNNHDYVRNNHGCSLRNPRNMELLPKIISQYKSSVTRIIRKKTKDYEFAWQKSFYDHIVRNEEDLFRIRKYILNNPLKWALDKYNPDNWGER